MYDYATVNSDIFFCFGMGIFALLCGLYRAFLKKEEEDRKSWLIGGICMCIFSLALEYPILLPQKKRCLELIRRKRDFSPNSSDCTLPEEVNVFADGGQYSIRDSFCTMTFCFTGAYYRFLMVFPSKKLTQKITLSGIPERVIFK